MPELLDRVEVCRFFGTRPINASTLYRGIKAKRYPQPVHVGGLSRWLRSECESVLQKMVDGRAHDHPKITPQHIMARVRAPSNR